VIEPSHFGRQPHEHDSFTFRSLLVVFYSLVGVLLQGFLLFTLFAVLMPSTSKRAQIERVNQVKSLLKQRQIPRHLRTKVVDYYEYYVSVMLTTVSEKEILDGVPRSMRYDLTMAIHTRLIREVPILARMCTGKGPRRNLVCSMLLRMKLMIAQPDDHIMVAGSEPNGLFIVVRGA
jgi:hypothetical protein